jgi:adenylate kinase family enzyme
MKFLPLVDRRIVVIGTSCTGKSTFASALSRILDVSHIELDELFWGPHWTPKSDEAFQNLVLSEASAESWVADGNYGSTRQLLWSRATTIVWLNYSFHTVLWHAIKRTVVRSFTRKVLWHGNQESIRRSFFSKDSMLVWVAKTFRQRQREYEALRASGAFPHLSWVEFQHPAQAMQLLKTLHNVG